MNSQGSVVERFDLRALPDDSLRELHAFEELLGCEKHTNDLPRPFENYAAAVRNMPTYFEDAGFLVRDRSGTVAGVAEGVVPRTSENAHFAQVSISVRPDLRRRGIGRALLSEALGFASSRGRTLLTGVTYDRIPAGEAFARRLGAEPALISRVSRLVLATVDRSLLDDWIAHAPVRAPGYSLVQVDGRCPDGLVQQVVALLDVMNDAPRGALQLDDRRLTVEQFREVEDQAEAEATVLWRIFARHDDSGELVGLTEVKRNPGLPQTIGQGDTGVRPAHRGHALGKWLKAVMLRRILDECSESIDVRTNNADSNAAMRGINDALGFEPYIAQTVWQADAERIRAQLNSAR